MHTTEITIRRFGIGQLAITTGALTALLEAGQTPNEFLDRHVGGDWGSLTPEEVVENECALERQALLMSVYGTRLGMELWVITEGDRSLTTILLPVEY